MGNNDSIFSLYALKTKCTDSKPPIGGSMLRRIRMKAVE